MGCGPHGRCRAVPGGNTLASDASGPGSTPVRGPLELDTGYHPFGVMLKCVATNRQCRWLLLKITAALVAKYKNEWDLWDVMSKDCKTTTWCGCQITLCDPKPGACLSTSVEGVSQRGAIQVLCIIVYHESTWSLIPRDTKFSIREIIWTCIV